ncbi:MAG: hypothetical protein JWL90_2167 [Chthoniobacteraceae bacterium]|nr:hypothetical protein [Chthoniobacteraceae bacterium]
MRFRTLFLLILGLGWAGNPVRGATELPFSFIDGMIWLKINVPTSALPLNFLLDSGASSTVLDLKSGIRLGAALGRRETAQGAAGQIETYQIKDFRGTFGAMALPRSILAVDLRAVSGGLHQKIDGLLGADFLKDRIVQVDFRTRKIRFLESNELSEAGMEILPLKRRNDVLCVEVSVAGQPHEWMRLDTGCRDALQWVSKTAMNEAVKSNVTAPSIKTDVRLGSLKLQSVPTGLHQKPMFRGEAGLLGNGLLSKFTFTIDSVRGRLLLLK